MLKRLAIAAVTAGLILHADYGGMNDYRGTDVEEFMKAMNACDEMLARFYDENDFCHGWALYISGLDADEQIAYHDTGGFVNIFLNHEGL